MKHLLTSLPLKNLSAKNDDGERRRKKKNEWNKSKCVVAAHCRRNRCHCRRQNFLSHKLNGMRKWKLLTFIGLRHTLAMVCVWMFLIKFVWIWNFSFNEISSLDRDILIDSKWKIAFAKTQNQPVHAYQRHTHTHIYRTQRRMQRMKLVRQYHQWQLSRILWDAAGTGSFQCGKHSLPASIIYINIIICVWDVKYMMLFSTLVQVSHPFVV